MILSTHIPSLLQDVPVATCDRDVSPVLSAVGSVNEELAHELRQPLSVIEALAYYVEITSADDRICDNMQRIRDMIAQVSVILDRNFAGECSKQAAAGY